jgi:cytochrome P450
VIELFSEGLLRDPFPVYDQLRQVSPLFREPRSGLWMIFDYDGVKRVLSDHTTFSSRNGPNMMVFQDPPRHTRLRALISQAFTPRTVANLEPRIRELSRELIDRVIERGEMDLTREFANPLPMLVIAEMLGIPGEDRERFHRWSDTMLFYSHTIPNDEHAAEAQTAFETMTLEMQDYLAQFLGADRRNGNDSLLSALAAAEVDGARLTPEDILGFFKLLILAGQETTTNLISNAILCLTETPDQFSRLRSSRHLLPSAIEEVLRYRSPVQWVYRLTTTDVELHGQTLREGTLILAMIGSANRDPRQFPNAGRFDITREPNAHLAFGHGIHFCLGAALARLEASIALGDLLDRLDDLKLNLDGPWPPRKGIFVHGPERLSIRFRPASRPSTPSAVRSRTNAW